MRNKKHRFWVTLLVSVAVLGLITETGRRLLLGHSLYKLNLNVPVEGTTLPPVKPGENVLIFAPHPDDESLGCGGLIQQAVAAGADVHVVLITNGEYPEISVVLFEETAIPKPEAFIKLGYMRQQETAKAMEYLGFNKVATTYLGYPNQFINQMWSPEHWLDSDPVTSRRTRTSHSPYSNSRTPGAAYCGDSLLTDIRGVLETEKPDIVVTIFPADIHIDHWPTYAFVAFALNELKSEGEDFAKRCKLYTYLIHYPHWPVPRSYKAWLDLAPPATLANANGVEWHPLPLTLAQTIDKHKAIKLYRTQGGSIDPLLRSFARSNELYGILQDGTWPINGDVQPIPAGEYYNMHTGKPSPGISEETGSIRLGRVNNRLVIESTVGKGNRLSVKNFLSVHAGGPQVGDRAIYQVSWQGETAELEVLRDGKLLELPLSDLSVLVEEGRTVITAPWPVDPAPGKFFLVRAWREYKRHTIQQTCTKVFRFE